MVTQHLHGSRRPAIALAATALVYGLAPLAVEAQTAPRSINSTSQSGAPRATQVPEQPRPRANNSVSPAAGTGLATFQVLAVNDLGMHCGDLDTRVASILPPFNVILAQVVRKGPRPTLIRNPAVVGVFYSAASNPGDPAAAGPRVLAPNGAVYKTNFWTVARQAYAAFYPPAPHPLALVNFYPFGANILDLGLPVPDTELLYLGGGGAAATQQSMPGRTGPYRVNVRQAFADFVGTRPFFMGDANGDGQKDFPFGYQARVDWYEAAGVPISAFDDWGRENPYPLMRVQAVDRTGAITGTAGRVLASIDTVVPVSAEADCKSCHGDPAEVPDYPDPSDIDRYRLVAQVIAAKLESAGRQVSTSLDDPRHGTQPPAAGQLPLAVNLEWAADRNILQLHDLKHGTTLMSQQPVVCQRCHYTPALDLAQVGPNDVNGRQQSSHKTMSNVMHGHHGRIAALNPAYAPLFPAMPAPLDALGATRNPARAQDVLEQTCYQCHPGSRTQCLRGAMASADIVCQDCHGSMFQVGNDFSRRKPAGAFQIAASGRFYTDPGVPRVPWAHEPSCGSCHTGDAVNNLLPILGASAVVNARDSAGHADSIRLRQAYRRGDPKATPIVPRNRRFAEDVVTAAENPAAAGNPKLYRVSTGHGAVFCEGCHGSTHAEWPNANPLANDNVTAIQLQGHGGTITECSTCHTGDLGNTLAGPHGMHPVGTAGRSFARGGHEGLARSNPAACRACHGSNGQGTVLARVAAARTDLQCEGGTLCPGRETSITLSRGTVVGCGLCHGNPL
jgi:hypothetical protein